MSDKVILPNELHLGQILSKIRIIILIVCLIISYEFDDKLLKSRSIRLLFFAFQNNVMLWTIKLLLESLMVLWCDLVFLKYVVRYWFNEPVKLNSCFIFYRQLCNKLFHLHKFFFVCKFHSFYESYNGFFFPPKIPAKIHVLFFFLILPINIKYIPSMSLSDKFSQSILFNYFIMFFSVSSLFRESDILRLDEDSQKLNHLTRVRRLSKKEAWTQPQVFK